MELEIERAPVPVTTIHPGGIKTNIARNARLDPSVTGMTGDSEKARADIDRAFITSPEKAARQILSAVQRDRRRALIGPDAKVIDFVSRLPASLYQGALAKGARFAASLSGRAGPPTPWNPCLLRVAARWPGRRVELPPADPAASAALLLDISLAGTPQSGAWNRPRWS